MHWFAARISIPRWIQRPQHGRNISATGLQHIWSERINSSTYAGEADKLQPEVYTE